MGSGGSKEKSQKTSGPIVVAKSDHNSKPTRPQNIESSRRTDVKNSETNSQVISHRKESPPRYKEPAKSKTPRGNRNSVKRIESDSESDGEDIADIIAATKREHNNRVQEQNYYNANKDVEYPETYAQRLQREQYQQQQMLVRQKTIYRNPDEWEVDEAEEETEKENVDFDVQKFKQANAATNIVQTRNNYSSNNNDMTKGPVTDLYHTQPYQKTESLPQYDMSEEALLAEIEKEYEY